VQPTVHRRHCLGRQQRASRGPSPRRTRTDFNGDGGVDADDIITFFEAWEAAFEQADDAGLIHRVESRDFLVRTAELDLGAGPILPRAGDQVRETVGTASHF
jgi:hypothetical protein